MQAPEAKGKQTRSSSNSSTTDTSQDPDSAYQRTREGLIESLKLVNAVTEATSFLGPLKATCEISLLFLETTKAIDDNTKGLKQLRYNLTAHISVLDEGYAQAMGTARMEQMPDALKDFDHALREYISGLKDILARIDELMQIREKGVKGFFRKVMDAKSEVEAISDYKQDIVQRTRVFEDMTKLCHIQLEAEVWKMARLGPEQPRPMGTQHKTCLLGTRGPILQEIRQWHLDPTVERIFWLCDVGGSGKSTVALTMCEEWDNTQDVVVGRFFFSKNARKTSETDDFCSDVAGDICAKSEEIMRQVESAKQKDPQLLKRGLRHQFAKLVEEPLRNVNKGITIVVDAVDECKEEMRGDLISLLLEKLPSMPNLKLFITSRPEADITSMLQGRSIVRGIHFKMHGKGDQSNLADITTYVDAHLAKMLTAPERQQLVERSNGLFIWITTAHLELKKAEGPDAVEATLKVLLTRGEGGDINQIYTSVVRRLLRERSLDDIRRVMGTILTLFEPVSTEALSKLTGIRLSELESIVISMQSVFRAERVVEFLHPTFREYLLGEHNSDMPFDITAMQSLLAISVLQTLQDDLKEDICGISRPDEPYPDNTDVPDLDERLRRVWCGSPALPYSIRYWGSHTSPVVTSEYVARVLRMFLESGILYLIELLSLTGEMHLIRNFEEVRRSYHRSDGFEVELCRDAVRLVQRNQKVLEQSALHIYSSGLLFLPRKATMWTVYGSKYSHRLPRFVGSLSEDWPSHQILAEHQDHVSRVAYSPDGLRIASGSKDSTLRLWDATTGASIAELKGHTSSVSCLSFSPDGLRIASGSNDNTLRLWDAINGTSIAELKGHTSFVSCLAFSPDGARIASGSWDETLQLWDGTTGASIAELKGHTSSVNCLAFSPDGLRIASGSNDGTLRLWDGTTGASIAELKGHSDFVPCVAFSPDGLRIVSGSCDKTLLLWDATTPGASIAELKGHTSFISCLAFSPDGLRIASGSWNGTLRLWDGMTGASITELKGHPSSVNCLAFSPDGLHIASGSSDKTLQLWDAMTGTSIGGLKGHTDSVLCLAISPDGVCIASGSLDKTLRLWDWTTGASTAGLEQHTDSLWCLAFSPDGLRIASASSGKTPQLWDATTGASIAELKGHTSSVRCLAFSPDGARIASGSDDRTLRLWDATTGASIAELTGHTSIMRCLAISPDGLRIASGSSDKTLRLWDGMTGASIAELKGHTDSVVDLAFSPDGLRIASGASEKTLQLWDATSGASIAELKGHTSFNLCLAFSPDGLLIASGSSDNTIRLWDGMTGTSIAELKGHPNSVFCLAFSPDGLRIASGSTDNTLRLWDVTTASSLGPPYTLSNEASSLYYANDGRSIQTDNGILLDTSQGCLQRFTSPTSDLTYSSPPYTNLCIDPLSRELWCIARPHRRYNVPQELEWSVFTMCKDAVAFGSTNGQVLVIRFTDVVAS